MKGRTRPFADLQPTPANHFRLCFYLAVLNAMQQASRSIGSWESALAQFPFLAGYQHELAEHSPEGLSSSEVCVWWADALDTWELSVEAHLPLRALCEAEALDRTALTLLLTVGLVEEDARFGFLFEYLQGIAAQPRPTQGLLHSWFGSEDTVRTGIRRMLDVGLIQVSNADAPRSGRALQVPTPLWDALRGERP